MSGWRTGDPSRTSALRVRLEGQAVLVLCRVGGKGEWLCLLPQMFRFCLRVLALEETRGLGSLEAESSHRSHNYP